MFVSLLLERGYRVLALTPDRKVLESRLAQRQLADHPMLHVLDWDAPRGQLPKRRCIREMWHWWLSYGKSYADQSSESRVVPGMSLFISIKKRVFQIVVPPFYRASRAVDAIFLQQKKEPEDSSEMHYLRPADMADHINAALKASPWRPDCFLNMYMDMYKTGADAWRQFASICRMPWGGIRFVPSDTPPREGYYRLLSLRGMCFLDELTCKAYQASLSGKYFQYLPDITYAELPEYPCSLAEEIRCRAAGRRMIFLGGSISGQKNIACWSELIALADPKRWFFVQVGEVHANTFSPEDIVAFERLMANPPENLALHTHYVSDEREFNAIIQNADILFAVYRNFRNSSNMLGKAAYFEKPILVSEGYLMGDRVCRYGIGLAVPQDDVQAMLCALERLVKDRVPSENFSAYRETCSEEAAGDSVEQFVRRLLAH